MVRHVYVIMVESVANGQQYVSGVGYDTPQKARDFMVKERDCVLYENSFMEKQTEYGWYGKPKHDETHRYYIKEITIR